MFSIAAINDTDSRGQWEPLAPTKEAQEFHLSQTYHDGLVKLQAKEYDKARELLETVLKDPLISSAQVDSTASDGHLLQLRFLALKNLATVFLEQSPAYYDNALHCYLQAVEIDSKDSVVWNQLGTLSCSVGLLSISRWAFEQGLSCSPNNWNCMEKLLEVLIAIGDEVACLSVAELILRHWPSHSRALHVKNAIEETESIPFTPRGIDKLEPKHVKLKFPEKRKGEDNNLAEEITFKKLKQNIELHVTEATWTALAGALLGFLMPPCESGSEAGADKSSRSRDVRLSILLPQRSENVLRSAERKARTFGSDSGCSSIDDLNSDKGSISREKEAIAFEDQPQERRSSRLERLRSRKPDKDEMEFATSKDLAKVVLQFLQPYVLERAGTKDSNDAYCSFSCADVAMNPLDAELNDVTIFVNQTSKNYGAYHVGHLLLEEVAWKGIVYQNDLVRFLELEKLTRHWGKDRTPECSLFLAELYYDFGSHYSDEARASDFMLEASYHLCKVIEAVVLDYPFHVSGDEPYSSADDHQGYCATVMRVSSLLGNKRSFWVRYYWLSGQLSIFYGNKEKAQEQFYFSLSLLTNETNTNGSLGLVSLPHCKFIKDLTSDTVFHEINIIDVDLLLKKTIPDMIEKNMHLECINLLAPLLFSTKGIHHDMSCVTDKGEEINSVELSALDVLIQACVKTKTMDTEVYLKSRLRRLRILMVEAGIEECFTSCKKFHQISSSRTSEPKESTSKHWNPLVAEEVKAISQSVSKLKNFIFPYGESDCLIVKMKIIGEIQSLLVAIMCNIANAYFSKKSVGIGILDKNEERQKCCFVEAAIVFCKLQHLNPHVLIKAQIELIAAIHDMLAEYGICCAAGDGEEEEGTFLKFAIKHLLALDMKLKSNLHPLNMGLETSQSDENLFQNNHVKRREQICDDINIKRSPNEPKLDILDANVHHTCTDENRIIGMYPVERINSNIYSSHGNLENDQKGGECCKHVVEGPAALHGGEQSSNHFLEFENELTDEEREELELSIDNALDQCFFCLYGLNLRSESSYEDDISLHKNTSRGDYQTKEQCADVFQYILPYAKGSSKTGLVKLRRVLRAIRKHFPKPPDDVLAGNTIDKFLDDPNLCENKLSEEAGSDGFLDSIMKIFSDTGSLKQQNVSPFESSEPYLEVYCNLYYLLAQSEEMNATDKWAGFVLTKEGEEFVEQNAKLFKYDLLYNPLRFESWQRLANIYDEEVDLLLNDGSKQINVEGWRKNASFPQRVETSRRRSRRCLLMTLALARTAVQQGEIHELLALVYYDGVQNVVPFYDQRSIGPSRDAVWEMFCRNSMRHFKKAFAHKKDWPHAYYLGKLCEKLGYSHDISFSYYDKAMTLNPSAVDPFYRMHASRLKLLNKCGKQNEHALKVVAAYSFNQSTKETVMTIFERMGAAIPDLPIDVKDDGADANADDKTQVDLNKLEEVWNMLYSDCLSALEICVEGDLKHFHKARYMLSQGLYRRGESGDIEKAKEELSFCFKSTRSCFTFNMWEIDGTVRKGKRKTPGVSGNRKVLEVNLSESSRKFITCIRKYILFYLKLLELTGDISTLDRAYISIRSDKRFNLCLEDLVPVALGRYINALILSLHQTDMDYDVVGSCVEHLLEKMFSLYLEQMNLWSDLYSLPDISSPDLTESSLYGYLNQYVQLLERNAKLETLEGINEKLRKRLKNPKLSNSNCTKVYKHVSFAWCQTLVISMALITPLHTRISSDIQVPNLSDSIHENAQLLCVDMQTDELWNSSFEDPNHLKSLEAKWNPMLCKIKNVIIKKASDEDLDTAAILLRSSYNFYKDTSCAMLPSGINLYTVPSQLAAETYIQPAIDGVDILDMSTPRKLLLWAYTLLHGHCANISAVVKYCEENVKSKMRKGTGSLPLPSNTSLPTYVPSHTGDGKDGMGKCSESNSASVTTVITSSLLGPEHSHDMVDTPMAQTGSLSSQASASLSDTENLCAPSVTFPETENAFNMLAPSLLKSTGIHVPYSTNSSVSPSNAQDLLNCNNNVTDGNVGVVQGGDVPDKG